MISVIFNANWIASITMLPRGEKFTKIFYYDSVIADFMKNVGIPKTRDERRKVKLHCDNAPPHRIDGELEALNIPRVHHPSYSPDLAHCDFFLFGFLKSSLEGRIFKSDQELLTEVCVILESIPQSTLQRVYNEWVQRLQKCIKTMRIISNKFSFFMRARTYSPPCTIPWTVVIDGFHSSPIIYDY